MPETAVLPSPSPAAAEDFGRFNEAVAPEAAAPVEDFGRFSEAVSESTTQDFGRFTDAALAATPPPPVPSPTPASDAAAIDVPAASAVPIDSASSTVLAETPIVPQRSLTDSGVNVKLGNDEMRLRSTVEAIGALLPELPSGLSEEMARVSQIEPGAAKENELSKLRARLSQEGQIGQRALLYLQGSQLANAPLGLRPPAPSGMVLPGTSSGASQDGGIIIPRSGTQIDQAEARMVQQQGALVSIPKAEITQDQSIPVKAVLAGYNTVASFAEGMTSVDGVLMLLNPFVGAAGVAQMIPQLVTKVREADKTPPNSPERWQAASDVIALVAAPAILHGAVKLKGGLNAKQITETAQSNGVRARPEVPLQINQPAADQGGERVPAGGQGPPLGAGAQEAPAHLAATAADLGLRYQGTFGPKGLLQFTGDATNPSTFYVSPEVTAEELRAKAAEVKAARVSQPAKERGEIPKAVAPVDVGAAAAEPVPEVFGFGPGAAAEKEPLRPADPTAKQLADQISGIKTNDPERFSKAVGAVVDKVGATKDAAARAGAAVGNLARGFKRLIWDAPDPTNFDRWKGRWDAALQYNDFQISRLGDALEKAVPNVKRQTAIYNWAAADGDMALLQERADKAPEDVKQGYLDAMALTPEEERVANLQRSAYDEWLERAVENGMLTEGVENYLKRIVTKRPGFENELRAKIGTGKFTTSFREGKRRFWDDMIDAERAGIRYDKRIRGQSLYAQSFEHAVINRTAVRQFFDGETESGRPFAITEGMGIPVEGDAQKSPALLVTPFGARAVRGAKELASQLQTEHPRWSEEKSIAIAKEKILAEYEPLDHPAFKNWQWVHTMEDGTTVLVRGDALVHSSIASKLRNAFVKDRIDWVEPILRAQGFIKGSKLSLSLFHNVHEAINAAGHLTNPANLRPLSDLLEMPEIKMGMEAGLKLVGGANEQAYFAEGMGSHGWPELVPVLGDYVKAFKDATFEDWIPRLKAEAYLRAFERNQKGGLSRLRPTKKLTPEQNAIITARQVNASFGEQNYRQMMRDPRLQQALQGLFLAPDFGESKVRNMGQIFTRYGSEQRMALGVVAAGIYLGARILNQALTGNPQWNKPFTVVAGDKEYTLRSLPGDLSHALLGPHSYLVHRLSPLVQNAVEFLFKRDYRGVPVDWSTMVKDTLLSAIPIPLTYRKGLSWKDQLASALGVTPIPPPKPPKRARGSVPRPKASGMVKHKDRR